jgi:hypothetical protein
MVEPASRSVTSEELRRPSGNQLIDGAGGEERQPVFRFRFQFSPHAVPITGSASSSEAVA